jgi:hypothetical protein
VPLSGPVSGHGNEIGVNTKFLSSAFVCAIVIFRQSTMRTVEATPTPVQQELDELRVLQESSWQNTHESRQHCMVGREE